MKKKGKKGICLDFEINKIEAENFKGYLNKQVNHNLTTP